jgi:hypothetical protein
LKASGIRLQGFYGSTPAEVGWPCVKIGQKQEVFPLFQASWNRRSVVPEEVGRRG